MSEHSEQSALFEWAAIRANQGIEPLRWMFAIPNGGLRNKVTAARLKSEGVRAGVPDIMLPWPAMGYCGLFIEMKVVPNKPTPDQISYLEWLTGAGYLATVAYGWEEAKATIEFYVGEWSK